MATGSWGLRRHLLGAAGKCWGADRGPHTDGSRPCSTRGASAEAASNANSAQLGDIQTCAAATAASASGWHYALHRAMLRCAVLHHAVPRCVLLCPSMLGCFMCNLISTMFVMPCVCL